MDAQHSAPRGILASALNLYLHIATDPLAVQTDEWNALLACQPTPTPFMRHEYLAALQTSGSATPATGWAPRWLMLREGPAAHSPLAAACPLYLKSHSWGEYVFDFAWARAYAEHGLPYYPKALVAVPFTPVPGSRLLARDNATRLTLVQALRQWVQAQGLSSLHLLFGDAADLAACRAAGMMLREQIQFHWHNRHPASGAAFTSFDDFLAALSQDKRKKIRQERRRVTAAGVQFRHAQGTAIGHADWAFFYRCHQHTCLAHGNPPYLSPAFFAALAAQQPQNWLMFVAERAGQPIAASLLALNSAASTATENSLPTGPPATAYGRYWGALESVDSLHFEACYYQPIDWCIRHGIVHFQGGAQGQHKLARALLPRATQSAHWLAQPAFAQAVQDFLHHENAALARYQHELAAHQPFRKNTACTG